MYIGKVRLLFVLLGLLFLQKYLSKANLFYINGFFYPV